MLVVFPPVRPVMKYLGIILASLFLLFSSPLARASHALCPFCEGVNTPTLLEDFKESELILFGRLENPQLKDFSDGTTDLVIEEVIKSHPLIKGKTKVSIPRYVQRTDLKFLVFCRVYKDNLDPFR